MTKSSYVIMLQAAPDDYETGVRALLHAQKLLANGDQLTQVFFYGPGVIYANQYLQFPSGYQDLQKEWQNLAEEYNLPLVVCATVGPQYGLEALSAPAGNLANGFLAGGLAEFIETLANTEHLVQFQGNELC